MNLLQISKNIDYRFFSPNSFDGKLSSLPVASWPWFWKNAVMFLQFTWKTFFFWDCEVLQNFYLKLEALFFTVLQ